MLSARRDPDLAEQRLAAYEASSALPMVVLAGRFLALYAVQVLVVALPTV
jgi:hypothetical protein